MSAAQHHDHRGTHARRAVHSLFALLLIAIALCCIPVDSRADEMTPEVRKTWKQQRIEAAKQYGQTAANEPVVRFEKPPVNIADERKAVWEQYKNQRHQIGEDLRAGTITPEEAQARVTQANQQRFGEARTRGTAIESELDAIKKRTTQIRTQQLKQRELLTGKPQQFEINIKNTGTPLTDPSSRGIFGDQDLTFISDADRAAFVQAAKERGYTVKGKLGEGYVIIDELDIVAHGPSEIPRNPLDLQARLQTHYRAGGHESFSSRGGRYTYLKEGSAEWSAKDALGAVADNIKKVEHDLHANPAKLAAFEQETWAQNMAKGTMRAMEASGKKVEELKAALDAAQKAGDAAKVARIEQDLDFLNTLKRLKTEMDPRVAGLVPISATDDEAAKFLEAFKQKCLGQLHEAYQAGLARNQTLLANMETEIAQLVRAGKSAQAAELMAERAAIIDGAAQAVQHLTGAADGGKLLAEIAFGGRLTPTIKDGQRGYLIAEENGTRFVSEAEVKAVGDGVLNDARVRLGGRAQTAAVQGAGVGLGNMSKLDRTMLYFQAIFAAQEAVQREDEAARKEKRPPSYVRAYMEALAIMLGKTAYEAGLNASNKSLQEEFDRIDQMIKAGQDPNLYWSDIRGLTKTLLRTTGELTGTTGIVEDFAEMVDTALNVMNGPAHIDELVRQRADALAATLESDRSALDAMVPGLEEIYPEAKETAEEVQKAAAPLEQVMRSFEQIKQDVAEYDRIATWNNVHKPEIDTLRQDILASIKHAEDLSVDIYRNGGELCRSTQKMAVPADKSTVVIPPQGFSEDWNSFRDTQRKQDQAVKDIAAKRQRLQAMVQEYNDNNTHLELLSANARPMQVAGTLPDLLDEVIVNAELATGPVSKLKALAQAIASRAQGMRRRAEMLYHAKVMEEQALEFMVQADRILEKVKTYDVARMTETISNAYEKYPREIDRITDAAEKRQAILDQALAEPLADLDVSDIETTANAAATTYTQADQAYNNARACAEKVLGSMAVPLPPRPGASTGGATIGKPGKPQKTVENKPLKPPAYLFRLSRPEKPEEVSLSLYGSIPKKDDHGLYLFGDGTGGVYHTAGEFSGPYSDTDSLCAVLRGYGRHLILWGNGPDYEDCPKDGPTAPPAPLDTGAAATNAASALGNTGPFQIGLVKGAVQSLSSTGATQPINNQTALTPGMTVQTGTDGEVSFNSPGGTAVILGPRSEVRLLQSQPGARDQGIELLRGSIDINRPPGAQGPDDVRIQSAGGTIIANGTKYRVGKEQNGTRVQVFEGSVHLTGDYIIRTYAPGTESGKPSPVKALDVRAGEQALMMDVTSKPSQNQNIPSWMQRPAAPLSAPQTSDPGKPSALPAWLAASPAPATTAITPALSLPDPWNHPHVQQLMDQWISRAVPQSNTPGVVMHYNEWLQPLSQAARSTGAPDHPADWTRYRYLWENRMRYGSSNLCTLGEFLERSLSGKGMEGCAQAAGHPSINAPIVTPPPVSTVAQPRPATKPTPRPSDDIVVKRQETPDFHGDWDCTVNMSGGQTTQESHRIMRDSAGNYRLWLSGGKTQLPASYVKDNKIGFVITQETPYGGVDQSYDLEINNGVITGSERLMGVDVGSMRCIKVGIPGGKG